MWRNYRLSLSFANLVYLRAWADLIPLNAEDLYHRKTVPGFSMYFALVGDVLVLSLLIFALLSVAPRLPGWLRRVLPAAAIAVFALAIGFLRSFLLHYVSTRTLTVALAVLFIAAMALALRFSGRAARIVKGAILAATPCLAVTFLAPLYYLSGPSAVPPDPPLAQRLPGSPPVRVVWVVFDDWDQRLTFENLAQPPEIPTLLDLANRSFFALRALPAQEGVPVPAMATEVAVPSLLYGNLVRGAEDEDGLTRRLVFAHNNRSVLFGSGDNIFARVRAQGWNAAVAGWYLPYCRSLASEVTDCYWDVRYDQSSAAGAGVFQTALDETRMLFETEMYSPFGRTLVDKRHFEEYETLLAAARRYAADPAIGFAFIHFNVPHMPYFYNPDLGRFGRRDHPDDLYIDSLRSVDDAVKEILSSLRQSGMDSKTALILSSDHPARLITRTDSRVPFIVHLPGEETGLPSLEEFSALGTADLVLAIANGQVQSPRQVEQFLVSGNGGTE